MFGSTTDYSMLEVYGKHAKVVYNVWHHNITAEGLTYLISLLSTWEHLHNQGLVNYLSSTDEGYAVCMEYTCFLNHLLNIY